MKRYRNNFTLIELLLVIGIMGILLAVGASGLRNLTGGAGVTGTVRNLSSQLSLARSYAASRNRFVAVLLPDATIGAIIPNNTTAEFNTDADKDKPFHKSRLCFVSSTTTLGEYNFDSWIDDNSWIKWDAGIAVFVKDGGARDASNNKIFAQVIDINGTTAPNSQKSTAIIFANSGALISDDEPELQVLRATYKPDDGIFAYSVEGEGVDHSWKVTINPFTGRTSFEKLY